MAALASAQDVGDFLGSSLIGDDEARAERLLDRAEDLIVDAVPGLTLEAETVAGLLVPGANSGTLVLPKRPITAVTAVSIDGEPLESWRYTFTRRGELVRRDGYTWAAPDSTVSIDATFGPAGADVAFVAIDLVRQSFANPSGARMVVLGARTAQFDATDRPMTITSAHRRILSRYRITATASALGPLG